MSTIVIEMESCAGCCDNIVAPAGLECRIKGGEGADTASLCGWPEYIDPSTPPKKYRLQSYNEDLNNCSYTNPDCTPEVPYGSTRTFVDDGAGQYNAATCVLTVSGTQEFGGTVFTEGPCFSYGGSFTGSGASTAAGFDLQNPAPFLVGFYLSSVSQILVDYRGTDLCTLTTGHVYRGYLIWRLTDEDTEDDAVARFEADTSWGSWEAVGGGCPNPGCCLAFWGLRGDEDFDFPFQSAQWRATAGALTPSTAYNVVTRIYRRAYGSSDAWTLYASIVTPTTSDGSGNISVTGDVPNDTGYESYAGSAFITTP